MKYSNAIKTLTALTVSLSSSLVFAQLTAGPSKSPSKGFSKLTDQKVIVIEEFKQPPKKISAQQTKQILDRKMSAGNSKGGSFDGGGGSAVACLKEDGTVEIKLLDYYQAQPDFGLELDIPGNTYLEKLENILVRFEKIAPVRAALYRNLAIELLTTNSSVRNNIAIPILGDTGGIVIENHCHPLQVAFQKNDAQLNLPGMQKKYVFDSDIFNAMDENHKAGLILHEVIYREAIANGALSSEMARYFTAFLSSHSAGTMTEMQYHEILDRMKIHSREKNRIPLLSLSSPLKEFVPNRNFKWTEPKDGLFSIFLNPSNPQHNFNYSIKDDKVDATIETRALKNSEIELNAFKGAAYAGQGVVKISGKNTQVVGMFEFNSPELSYVLNKEVFALNQAKGCNYSDNSLMLRWDVCAGKIALFVNEIGQMEASFTNSDYIPDHMKPEHFPLIESVKFHGITYSNFYELDFDREGKVTKYSGTDPVKVSFLGKEFLSREFTPYQPPAYRSPPMVSADEPVQFEFAIEKGKEIQKIKIDKGDTLYLSYYYGRPLPEYVVFHEPHQFMTLYDGIVTCYANKKYKGQEYGEAIFHPEGYLFRCAVKDIFGQLKEKRF